MQAFDEHPFPSKRVFLVSAGMDRPKKRDNPFARQHYYLNYGLLGLATILKSAGFDPIVVHGLFHNPESVLDRLKSLGLDNSDTPVLLSLPSFYSVPWASRFCKKVIEDFPHQKFVVGGRWVVNGRAEWIASQIPNVSLVVYGTAENKISNIVTNCLNRALPGPGIEDLRNDSNASPDQVEYSLLDEALLFNPSIEVSRGCGRGCVFCEEKDVKRQPLKSPLSIVRQAGALVDFYKTASITPYFEASLFLANHHWINELIRLRSESKMDFLWRCETRVDTITQETLELLAKSGLKVVDLGLESTSKIQLLRMSKTPRPDDYLRKADVILRQAKECGIWMKVNVLLFPGETLQTLNETVQWIGDRKDCIKGVSVGSTIVYGLRHEVTHLLEYYESLGAYPSVEEHEQIEGVTRLNISRKIDLHTAEQLSIEVSKQFMNARDYYDLKAFSYFSRAYLYEDFLKDLNQTNSDMLPFRVSGDD